VICSTICYDLDWTWTFDIDLEVTVRTYKWDLQIEWSSFVCISCGGNGLHFHPICEKATSIVACTILPLLRWWPGMFMDSNSDCSLSLLFSYLSESAKRCHPDQQGYSALALILTDLCISLHIQCINLFTSTPTAPLWNIQAILTLKQNVYTPACNGGSHAQERDPIICWSMSMHTGEEPYKLYE